MFQALSNKAAGIVSYGGISQGLRAVELIKSLVGAFPIHIGLGAVVLPFIQFSASRLAVSMLDEPVAPESGAAACPGVGDFDFSLPHRGGKTENGACG